MSSPEAVAFVGDFLERCFSQQRDDRVAELVVLRALYDGTVSRFRLAEDLQALIVEGSSELVELVRDRARRPIDNLDDARAFLENCRTLCFTGFVPSEVQLDTPEACLTKVREAIHKLSAPLVAIEALWDGDTNGWMLDLWLITEAASTVHPRYTEHCALTLRNGGGDFRLFTGEVPPWPESRVARLVGETIGRECGVPFHFPSEGEVRDDVRRWWDSR